MISFVSAEFMIFIAITFLIYFNIPIRYRWLVLCGSSICFYCGGGIANLLFVLVTAGIVYFITYRIGKIYHDDDQDKESARKILIVGIVLVLLLLLYAKIGNKVIGAVTSVMKTGTVDYQVIVPIGISYYTFSVIGYMADVYWRKEAVEHNYFKLLLYMIYFPHIIQGPIPRHKRLACQLTEGHRFQYRNFCYGLQRVLWGYFKKMVIADRLLMFTGEVFGNYTVYEGCVFWIAVICSAIEIYCDFSGCMDIVLGVSEAFGIHLDENFRRPFFSKTVAEFWRRWHITLSTWFKDYVYMPLVINPRLIALCQKAKVRFGKRFARNLLNVIPLAIVWLFTGVWHNTGMNYIIWGCYWGLLIILATVFAPEISKITKRLRINTKSKWFQLLQMIRTFLLYLISRLLVAPGDIKITLEIVSKMFMKWNPAILFDRSFYQMGMDRLDWVVIIIAVLILWSVSYLQERGIGIRDRIASLPIVCRWSIYYLGILAVLAFGVYGLTEDTFVYMFY